MSCSMCDCEDCLRSRHMNDFDDEDRIEGSGFGSLPPAPLFSRSEEELRNAMHSVFDQYESTGRIPSPVMVVVMSNRLQVLPHEWDDAQGKILSFLHTQKGMRVISHTLGKDGGLQRVASYQPEDLLGSPKVVSDSIINDHTCGGCGNTKCSKTEKFCWKCGAPILHNS